MINRQIPSATKKLYVGNSSSFYPDPDMLTKRCLKKEKSCRRYWHIGSSIMCSLELQHLYYLLGVCVHVPVNTFPLLTYRKNPHWQLSLLDFQIWEEGTWIWINWKIFIPGKKNLLSDFLLSIKDFTWHINFIFKDQFHI